MGYTKIYLNHIKYYDIAFDETLTLSKHLPFLPRYKLHKILVLYKTGRGEYKKYGRAFYVYQTENGKFQIFSIKPLNSFSELIHLKRKEKDTIKLDRVLDISFDKSSYFKVFIETSNKYLLKLYINSKSHYYLSDLEPKSEITTFLLDNYKNVNYKIVDLDFSHYKSIYKYLLDVEISKISFKQKLISLFLPNL